MIKIILLLLCVLSPVKDDHALYISVAEMSFSDGEVNIDLKVFSNDLFDALKNWKTDISSTPRNISIDDVQGYFDQHLVLSAGQQSILIKCDRVESTGDAHFIHFTGFLNNPVEPIKIKAAYFFELFPAQQNILKIKKDEKQSFFTMKVDNAEAIIK